MARRRSDKIWWNKPCVKCGYNLRGLYGDPVTCPECGTANPRRKPISIKYRTGKRMRRLELSLLAGIAGLVAIGVAIALFLIDYKWSSTVVFAAGVGSWVRGWYSFRRECASHSGWRRVFVVYQLVGVALAGTALPVASEVLAPSGSSPLSSLPAWARGCGLALVSIIPIAALVWGRRRLRDLARQQEYESAVHDTMRWQRQSEGPPSE
jgi:hypothetical protein